MLGKITPMVFSGDFKFLLYCPGGILGEYVSMIWASEGMAPFRQERVIPDAANVLVFNFGDPVSIVVRDDPGQFTFKKTLFTGIFSHFNSLQYQPGLARHTQAGAIFRPGCAFPFIQKPIIDFRNIAVETPDFGDRDFADLHERLGHLDTSEARISMLEKFLYERLTRAGADSIASQLIHLIRKNPEKNIEDITQKTGYSQQHFNRLLGKFAGVNAKNIQKIFRLNQAMQVMQATGNQSNLTEIAHDAGYYDQAHFIHDFREMTGMAPGEYIQIKNPGPSRIVYLY